MVWSRYFRRQHEFIIVTLFFAHTAFCILTFFIVPLLLWHLRLSITFIAIYDFTQSMKKNFQTTNSKFSAKELRELFAFPICLLFVIVWWNIYLPLWIRVSVTVPAVFLVLAGDTYEFFFTQTQVVGGALFPLISISRITRDRRAKIFQLTIFCKRNIVKRRLRGRLMLHWAGISHRPSAIFRFWARRIVIETIMLHRNGHAPIFIYGKARELHSHYPSDLNGIQIEFVNDLFDFFEENDYRYFNAVLCAILDHISDMGAAETTVGFLEPLISERERYSRILKHRRESATFDPFHMDYQNRTISIL